ncbi:MAG: hypothetical protein ACYDBS_08930, partial [Acidimicrobiales bacterium]
FTSGVQDASPSAPVLTRNYLFAANATTGAISSTFAPVLNADVQAVLPGPTAANGDPTVYVGGTFSTVNGVKTGHVALLDVLTGQPVAGFKAVPMNGVVDTMALTHGQLIVGGRFTTAAGTVVDGITSLDPLTGALTNYISFGGVQQHHSWTPSCSNCAEAPVGVAKIAISPDGTRMVMLGNFKIAGGLPREQVAMVDLTSSSAVVDPNWATSLYSAGCYYWAYDSYVRDVAFSPGGSYFAIAATGGGGTPQPYSEGCDSIARFETAGTGTNVQPTWVDYSGNDTIFSVAISSSAVYIGGHNRWLNNPSGADYAGAGAIPRPGIAALDPLNGLPYSWNPGRNPRGAAVYDMYLSSSGLWIGSNTDYIGNFQYYRAEIAFFPYQGGEILPGVNVPGLPGSVYLGTSSGLSTRGFQPSGPTVGSTSSVSGGSAINWSLVHGAFMVNGSLYYLCAPANGASCDSAGNQGLFTVTFNGATFGTPSFVQPFNDPYWENVKTGSGGLTPDYVGFAPPLYSQASSVTGLTYAGDQLFYTLAGSSALYTVGFVPEDGVVGAIQLTAPNSSVSFNGAQGLFAANGQLYWVDSQGALESAPFNNGAITGPSTVVNSADNWAANALFLGPAPLGSSPPAFGGSLASGRAGGTTSHSFAVTKASTAGDSILVSIAVGSATPVSSVTDSAGNVYQQVYGARAVNNSHPGLYVFQAFDSSALGSGGTITVTLGSKSNFAMQAGEWSGLSTATDGTASGNGTGRSAALGPVTTTNPNDVVLGFAAMFGSVSSSNVSTGWTGQAVSGGPSLSTAWQVESQAGSYGPTISWAQIRDYFWYEVALG